MFARIFFLAFCLIAILFLVTPQNSSALPTTTSLSLKIIHQTSGDFIYGTLYKGYLYAINPNGDVDNLLIFDLQNPAYPTLVTDFPTGLYIHDVEIEGDLLYFRAYPSDVYIFDISNPIAPQLLNVIDPGPDVSTTGMAVQGDILYLAFVYPEECDVVDNGRINIYDVSNPQTPILLGSKYLLVGPMEMESNEHYLYVLRHLGWVSIYDISDPAQLIEVGEYDMGEIHDIGSNIVVKYDTAYINYRSAGSPCYSTISDFRVINVANPGNILTIFDLPNNNTVKRFIRTVADGYLYTTNQTLAAGFQTMIFNMKDYENPVAIMDANEYGMVTSNGYVYALRNYLRVMRLSAVDVDVSDGQGYSLVYTDTVGLATQLVVAPGTVISGTNVSYLPLPAVDHPYPADHPFLEQAFDLAAYNTTTQQTFFTFEQPITLTLPYSAGQFDSWQFLYWDGQDWQDGGQTCGEMAERSPAGPSPFTFQLCRPGQYALFVPLHHTYLPLLAQTP